MEKHNNINPNYNSSSANISATPEVSAINSIDRAIMFQIIGYFHMSGNSSLAHQIESSTAVYFDKEYFYLSLATNRHDEAQKYFLAFCCSPVYPSAHLDLNQTSRLVYTLLLIVQLYYQAEDMYKSNNSTNIDNITKQFVEWVNDKIIQLLLIRVKDVQLDTIIKDSLQLTRYYKQLLTNKTTSNKENIINNSKSVATIFARAKPTLDNFLNQLPFEYNIPKAIDDYTLTVIKKQNHQSSHINHNTGEESNPPKQQSQPRRDEDMLSNNINNSK
jgi:hypothetical protein